MYTDTHCYYTLVVLLIYLVLVLGYRNANVHCSELGEQSIQVMFVLRTRGCYQRRFSCMNTSFKTPRHLTHVKIQGCCHIHFELPSITINSPQHLMRLQKSRVLSDTLQKHRYTNKPPIKSHAPPEVRGAAGYTFCARL